MKIMNGIGKNLPVLRPDNFHFREALDYQAYRIVDRSSGYDDEDTRNDAKLVKSPQVHLKSQTFDSFDPNSDICSCQQLN